MLQRSFIQSTKYISSLDPAIDRDHPDFNWEDYRRTGEAKHLPLREGAQATVFELAPLTRKQMARVLGFERVLDQCTEAVACGLRQVSNFIVDGQPLIVEHQGNDGERRVKSSVLDKLFDPVLFGELGTRIMEINRLVPTSG